MKKRAIRKDFYMEIRKSRGRFLSIFFIVALGVAFFSGIRASEPDMRYSGDAYFDRKNLMDIRVMGNMGMTDRDVEAIREVEGVGNVEPGYSADVLVETDGSQQVLHVSSILDTMNRYTLDEGRMPEKSGECLMDQDFLAWCGLEIGDEVRLLSGTDDALSDTFGTDTFTIVGSGSSASYISFDRGSSTIGNGEVSGFLAVLPEDFSMEVYTECYVSVKGAKELTAFTEEYDRKVDAAIEAIEAIEERQGKLRADDIRDEANEKLADAKKELADAEKEAKKELGDAKQKIEDGKQKLADGRKELDRGRAELEDNRAALRQGQQEIDAAYAGLEEGWAQLEAGQAELAEKEAEFSAQYESGMAQIEAGQAALDAGWQEWNTKKAEYDAGAAQLDGAKQQLRQLSDAVAGGQLPEEQLAQMQSQIAELTGVIAGQEPALAEAAAQLAGAEQTLLAKGEELEQGRTQLAAGQAAIEQARAELAAGQSELDAGAAQAEEGQRQIDEGRLRLPTERESSPTERPSLLRMNGSLPTPSRNMRTARRKQMRRSRTEKIKSRTRRRTLPKSRMRNGMSTTGA